MVLSIVCKPKYFKEFSFVLCPLKIRNFFVFHKCLLSYLPYNCTVYSASNTGQ